MRSIVRKMGIVLLALVTTLAFMFVSIGINNPGGAGVDTVYAGGPEWNVDVTPTAEVKNTEPVTVLVKWSWNSALGANSYVERYNVTDNLNNGKVGDADSNFSYTQFVDSTVESEKIYRYRVIKDSKYSKWSNDVTIPKKEESGGSRKKRTSYWYPSPGHNPLPTYPAAVRNMQSPRY